MEYRLRHNLDDKQDQNIKPILLHVKYVARASAAFFLGKPEDRLEPQLPIGYAGVVAKRDFVVNPPFQLKKKTKANL